MRKFISFSLAVGIMAAGVGIQPALAKTPNDTLVMAWSLSIYRTLDPADVGEAFVDEVMNNVCDAAIFLDYDDPSKLVPGIVESWSVSDDAQTYTFKIRQGLKFPGTGNPVRAEDLAWSMQRVVLGKFNSSANLTEWGYTPENIEELIQATDASTVTLKTTQPYAPGLFLASVMTGRVAFTLDKEEVVKHVKDNDYGNGWLQSTSACIGPYAVKTWKANDVFIMERNGDENAYWRHPVSIKRIVIRHVPESGAERLLLEKNDIDVARLVASADLGAIDANPDLKLISSPEYSYWYIGLCQCDDDLTDVRVRQAFKYLMDYQSMEDTAMKNVGIWRQSAVPAGSFGAIPRADEYYRLDLEKAKELLTAAGFPNGMKKTLIIDSQFPFPLIAQHVKENAAKIGLELEIQQMAPAQLYGKFRGRDFETGVFRWSTNVADANGMLSRHAYNPDNSDEANLTMFPAWRTGWNTKELGLNEMVDQGKVEVDTEKRLALYKKIQEIQLRESPFAYYFQGVRNVAVSKRVKGLKVNPLKVFYATVTKDD